MNLKLTRRQFGQFAIASTTTAAIGYFANKTFAQPARVIYGVHTVRQPRRLAVQSLNLAGGVQKLTTAPLEIGEQVTGFTSLANGTLVLSIAPVRAGKKENASPRLVFLGKSPRTLTISGLKKQETFESLLGTNDGALYGLVLKKNFRPPVSVVSVDLNTGKISLVDQIKLPEAVRFSKLAQSPDGTIYTTAVGRLGETSLVRLDLGQNKSVPLGQLKFNNKVWNSGLSDLVFSPKGELFALGARRYETPNYLHIVNLSTGVMTRQKAFDVAAITIPRA